MDAEEFFNNQYSIAEMSSLRKLEVGFVWTDYHTLTKEGGEYFLRSIFNACPSLHSVKIHSHEMRKSVIVGKAMEFLPKGLKQLELGCMDIELDAFVHADLSNVESIKLVSCGQYAEAIADSINKEYGKICEQKTS